MIAGVIRLPPWAAKRWRRMAHDRVERSMSFAGLSIPAAVATAVWKAALLLVAPSVFLLGNVVFCLGVAAAKGLAVRTHRRAGVPVAAATTATDVRRELHEHLAAYRVIGWLVLLLSLGFLASCLPMLLGLALTDRYEPPVAILIAVVAFVELVVAICGSVTARRTGSLLVEAVRLTNLAGAFALLVLTQTAILSFAYLGDGDPGVYNGVSGLVFGTAAAAVGLHMLLRAARLARRCTFEEEKCTVQDMVTISVTEARGKLPKVIAQAQHEAVFVEKHGKTEAVMVSPAQYERMLEALEDAEDAEAFDAAMAEEGENIPWAEAKADLGWE